ncbi:MAG: protein-glutamate O-methyltransferase CheR [Bacteroidetes bacterium]|nr:protein-glutamate O-methyltransferase CheR [Bacteroidota bacterium]
MNSITPYIDILSKESHVDFSQYTEMTINRKLEEFITDEKIISPEEFRTKFTTDKMFHMKLLEGLTVRYTELFRDHEFYMALRYQVLPYLSTFSGLRIWSAGCSTGEEAYSLAILLDEYGLLENTTIVATDVNPANIEYGKLGQYSTHRIREYTRNYVNSGGRSQLGKYYSVRGGSIEFGERLKKHIQFQQHDLVKDEAPGSFDLVLCRNVMIYFSHALQTAVTARLAGGVRCYGYLAVGMQESLVNKAHQLTAIDNDYQIYRKVHKV